MGNSLLALKAKGSVVEQPGSVHHAGWVLLTAGFLLGEASAAVCLEDEMLMGTLRYRAPAGVLEVSREWLVWREGWESSGGSVTQRCREIQRQFCRMNLRLSRQAQMLFVHGCTQTSVCADGMSKRAVRQNSRSLVSWQDAPIATSQGFLHPASSSSGFWAISVVLRRN